MSNPRPLVIPSLRQWDGGTGALALTAETRITVPLALTQLAAKFAADLQEITGLILPVLTHSEVTPEADDAGTTISLNLASDGGPAGNESAGERYHAEGYILEISREGVKVVAPSSAGLYYGTRSILQILAQSKGENSLPLGTAVDWPDYEVRGFMLDVGRRFFTGDFVRDYIKLMSYFKLNRFQLHLNDNQIFTENKDWTDAYAGFRLASDNPVFAGLASTDGSYSRTEWADFEAIAASRGVTIIPEIDGPAHAAAIIHWRPEVGRDNGKSDHLDLSKPESTQLMKDIFSEFTPWFHSAEVNFGADEYPRDLTEDFRQYYNEIAAHLRTLGKQPSAWGSFSYMGGGIAGYDKDVVINSWNNDW